LVVVVLLGIFLVPKERVLGAHACIEGSNVGIIGDNVAVPMASIKL
jgi:hypothetical protein